MAAESERAADPPAQPHPKNSTTRSWKPRLRKLMSWTVGAVIMLLFCGFAWNQMASWNFLRNYPPPGEMFDVDGIRLHAVIRGEREANQPAGIIESEVDGRTATWLHVVNKLERDNQVVVIDRRGIGYSDGVGGIRTPEQNVADLRQVLALKRVAPPYLLKTWGSTFIELKEPNCKGEP